MDQSGSQLLNKMAVILKLKLKPDKTVLIPLPIGTKIIFIIETKPVYPYFFTIQPQPISSLIKICDKLREIRPKIRDHFQTFYSRVKKEVTFVIYLPKAI